MNTKTNLNINDIVKHLAECTYKTAFYGKIELVGGCVRDEIMGIPIKDLDIMVNMPNGGIELSDYLCRCWPSYFKNPVIYERFGTAKITYCIPNSDLTFDLEFVEPRTEVYDPSTRKPIKVSFTNIETDALRRDFTVNAIYKNIHTNVYTDPTGHGIEDIKNMILRTSTNPELTMYDDPLRMMRAVRFVCQKGFNMTDQLFNAIEQNSYRLENISKERIQDEFIKIMMTDRCVDGIRTLYNTKLLYYMDENHTMHNMFGFDQRNPHHFETLDNHCLSVLRYVIEHNNCVPLIVRLSAFLHDIGKLFTYELKEDGVHYRFHGHDYVGSNIAYNILKELKFSNEICDGVKFIISKHMIMKQFHDENGHLKISDKSARKVLRKMDNFRDEILMIMDADNKSHEVSSSNHLWYQIDDFRALIPSLLNNPISEKPRTLKCPVNGNMIMAAFGVEPGPKIRDYIAIAQDIFDEFPDATADEIIDKMKSDENLIVK